MRLWVFLLLGLISVNFYGQPGPIEGKVFDSKGQPLYLALVFNADLSVGTYTDENGHFKIATDKQVPELEVFALGFSTQKVRLDEGHGFLTLRMEKLSRDLEEIEVTPCPEAEFLMGIDPGNQVLATLSKSSEFSYQAGKSFPTRYGQQITAVEIYAINPRLRRGSFRIRIYELDSTGKPGRDLLIKNHIVRVPILRNNRPIFIDLNEYDLRCPDTGILVAIEWLKIEENHYFYTSRYSDGNRREVKAYIPKLGLLKTDKNSDFNMWGKRDEKEWKEGGFPVPGNRKGDEVYLPGIRVRLKECK